MLEPPRWHSGTRILQAGNVEQQIASEPLHPTWTSSILKELIPKAAVEANDDVIGHGVGSQALALSYFSHYRPPTVLVGSASYPWQGIRVETHTAKAAPYAVSVRWRGRDQVSAADYVSIFAVGVVLERYANYLWFEQPIVWGQPSNVLTMCVFFGAAGLAWLLTPRRKPALGPLRLFLLAMAIAWVVHWALYRFHGDAMNYTAALYVPTILMILFKPPSLSEARVAVLAFAWATSIVLVLTRVLEMLGILSIRAQPEGIINFDEERYFLPLNDLMGIDGRWPGPFGHNGDTAMMGALLIVIAIAFWSRSSWVFLTVGTLALVLTNGRASIGAAAAGLVLIGMFSRSARLAVLPRTLRLVAGSILLVGGALFMFARPAGLTGREKIWPAFLELWWQSPLLGVGGRGIATGNEVAQAYGHAHSLYIDELARWGLAGFITQFAAIGIGVFIAARAAGLGYPGPLAVIVTYLITGITEPRNSWISPSATGFLLILMVVAAAAYLSERTSAASPRQEAESGDEADLTSTTGAETSPGDPKSGSLG